MRRSMLALALLAALLLAAGATPLAGATPATTVEWLPINYVTDGCEERILVTGTQHQVSHVSVDADGGVHIMFESNPQGVRGLGLTTGAIYRGAGAGRGNYNSSGPPPLEYTTVIRFNLIGPGPTDNLLVQETVHQTVRANGDVTSEVGSLSTSCRG